MSETGVISECDVKGCSAPTVVLIEGGYWLCRDHGAMRSGVTGSNVATLTTPRPEPQPEPMPSEQEDK